MILEFELNTCANIDLQIRVGKLSRLTIVNEAHVVEGISFVLESK
jgi:hypothetical protein